jgi:hypothetical protein
MVIALPSLCRKRDRARAGREREFVLVNQLRHRSVKNVEEGLRVDANPQG